MSAPKVKTVIISGKRGSGKTSTMDAVVAKLREMKGYRAENIIFAGPIYQMHNYSRNLLLEAGILTKEQIKTKDRGLLLWLGTEWGRDTIDKNIWVKMAKHRAQVFAEKQGSLYENIVFMISDCRFENELSAFEDALKVRLECPEKIRKERCESWGNSNFHPSEVGLDESLIRGEFDLVLNSGDRSIEEIANYIISDLMSSAPVFCRPMDDRNWALKNLLKNGYHPLTVMKHKLLGIFKGLGT